MTNPTSEKVKKIKASTYRTSAIFTCGDCSEEWGELKTARKEAYQHAKRTGHFVRGEIVMAHHYNHQ
jgi:uncharacterized Zn ribbon protein